MTEPEFDHLQGVAGLLILKILALEPMRRWGSARRLSTAIEQILQAS